MERPRLPSYPYALFRLSFLQLHCCLSSFRSSCLFLDCWRRVSIFVHCRRRRRNRKKYEDFQAGVPGHTQARQSLGRAPTPLVLFDHINPICALWFTRPTFVAPFVWLPIEERIGRLRVTVGAPSPFRRYRCWKMSLYQGEGWGEEEAERVVSPPS